LELGNHHPLTIPTPFHLSTTSPLTAKVEMEIALYAPRGRGGWEKAGTRINATAT
jgi:hypothetical protein